MIGCRGHMSARSGHINCNIAAHSIRAMWL